VLAKPTTACVSQQQIKAMKGSLQRQDLGKPTLLAHNVIEVFSFLFTHYQLLLHIWIKQLLSFLAEKFARLFSAMRYGCFCHTV